MAEPVVADRRTRRPPGRPRSQEARQRLLAAAGRLLIERGIASTSVDAIAADARVSKATLYRWWSSKEELFVEAVEQMRGQLEVAPATENPRADLTTQLQNAVRRYWESEGRGKLFPRLLDAAVDNAELAEVWRRRLITPGRATIAEILKRAVGRGDLSSDTDIELAIDCLIAPLLYRLHVTHAPVSQKFVKELVDTVWSGLAVRRGGKD